MIGVVIVRNSHLDTRTCRRFRYSDPQRQRITACVRNHDRFDFLALEYAANRYLATIGKRIRLPKERLKTIAAIGRLAITLRAKITGLNNPRDQEVFDTFLSIGGTSFRQTLGGLADLCRNQDTLLRRKLRPAVETPKLAFYREALSLLTDADGALKVKQRDGDPYGPTLDYLKAMTVPVMLNRAPKPGGIRAIVERERREREQEKATVRAIIECEYRAAREDARAPEDDNIAAYFDRSVAGLKELLAGLDDPAAEVGHFQWAILHFEQAIRALQIEYSDLSSQRRNGARYKALRSKIHDIRAIAGLRLHRKTLAQLASELGVSLRQSEPMSVSALRSLDAWIATQPDQPSRSEAMQLLALITGLHKLETRAAMETANTHTTRK